MKSRHEQEQSPENCVSENAGYCNLNKEPCKGVCEFWSFDPDKRPPETWKTNFLEKFTKRT